MMYLIGFAFSSSWKTLTPWTYQGEVTGYISKRSAPMGFFIYLGPICITCMKARCSLEADNDVT